MHTTILTSSGCMCPLDRSVPPKLRTPGHIDSPRQCLTSKVHEQCPQRPRGHRQTRDTGHPRLLSAFLPHGQYGIRHSRRKRPGRNISTTSTIATAPVALQCCQRDARRSPRATQGHIVSCHLWTAHKCGPLVRNVSRGCRAPCRILRHGRRDRLEFHKCLHGTTIYGFARRLSRPEWQHDTICRVQHLGRSRIGPGDTSKSSPAAQDDIDPPGPHTPSLCDSEGPNNASQPREPVTITNNVQRASDVLRSDLRPSIRPDRGSSPA